MSKLHSVTLLTLICVSFNIHSAAMPKKAMSTKGKIVAAVGITGAVVLAGYAGYRLYNYNQLRKKKAEVRKYHEQWDDKWQAERPAGNALKRILVNEAYRKDKKWIAQLFDRQMDAAKQKIDLNVQLEDNDVTHISDMYPRIFRWTLDQGLNPNRRYEPTRCRASLTRTYKERETASHSHPPECLCKSKKANMSAGLTLLQYAVIRQQRGNILSLLHHNANYEDATTYFAGCDDKQALLEQGRALVPNRSR